MITEDKGGDFETLMSREKDAMDFKRRLYKNPKFVAVAQKILPKFDTKGILDEMWIKMEIIGDIKKLSFMEMC